AGTEFRDPQTNALLIPAGGALENQAVGPILSDVEMAHEGRSWDEVITKLSLSEPMAMASYLPADMANAIAGGESYADLFDAAFGDPTITAGRIGMAIATYERTLVPDQTPFDTGSMTPQQQAGFNGFLSPGANCNICHQIPFFTDHSFRNIGVRPIPEDIGRQEVTGNPADAGRFKVPGLRNVGLRDTFMHNGRKLSLEQVLDFYLGVNGEQQFPQNIDPLIPPINFPPPVRADIIEFLRNGLTDPRVANETFPFDRPVLLAERGDEDRDGDVDMADFNALVDCFDGSTGGPVSVACQRLDMDADAVMTCNDYTLFQDVWTEAAPVPDFAICATPALNVVAQAVGPTSFEILLAGNPDVPFSIRVTGDSEDLDIACLNLYLQADGSLGASPMEQSLAAWGSPILVMNEWIIPEASYTVVTEGLVTDPVDVSTGLWGDVNLNGFTNLEDALLAVVSFQVSAYDPAADISPCQGDGTINLSDVLLIIQRWQGEQSYVDFCGVPCE
ncbi:MAG: cytochrome c peroxidase, partial [Phycisphaerae bacterium]